MKLKTMLLAAVAGLVPAALFAGDSITAKIDPELAPPVRVMAGDQPIDLGDCIGHAAPFFADIDGDGVKDLLVGQFKDGACRIYKNIGTNAAPKFAAEYQGFKAGGDVGKVPYG